MGNPLVSVVIVTWNRQPDVLAAVQSVYDQLYRPIEILVVDNGSTDGTVEALRRSYPTITVIALDHNRGAAGGRNPGLAATRGDIIFLLDSDASLREDALAKVVGKFGSDPGLGIVACKIVNAQTGELDSNSGWIFSERDKAEQDREFLSYSFCSAGAAIRREVIERVGLFWEQLFIYREEDDLSLRAWDAGYQVLYYPDAVVCHRTSPQKRVTGGQREYFDLRNSLYIYFVRYPWWMLARFAPLKVAVGLVKGIGKGCIGQVLRALADVVAHMPFLLKQRRPISNDTARRYLVLQREHGPLRWDLASWLRVKVGLRQQG